MELGTGAAVSIMSEKTNQSLFSNLQLDTSNIKLKSYSGETIPVVGQVNFMVKYEQQEKSLPLLVVQGGGHSLFGRNWLFVIKLDWGRIHSVKYDPLRTVLEHHNPMFQEGLGRLIGYEAKINMDPKASPHFCKVQPVCTKRQG